MKRLTIDPLWLQDHALCMLCYESTDKEEWTGLHKTGKQKQNMKSFSVQHSPKKPGTPGAGRSGTTHAVSGVGAVARPDSSSDVPIIRFQKQDLRMSRTSSKSRMLQSLSQHKVVRVRCKPISSRKNKDETKNKTIHGRRSWQSTSQKSIYHL